MYHPARLHLSSMSLGLQRWCVTKLRECSCHLSTFALQVGKHLDKASIAVVQWMWHWISYLSRGHSLFQKKWHPKARLMKTSPAFWSSLSSVFFPVPVISALVKTVLQQCVPLIDFSSHRRRPLASGADSRWKRLQHEQASHLPLMLWDFLQPHFPFSLHWKMSWQACKMTSLLFE